VLAFSSNSVELIELFHNEVVDGEIVVDPTRLSGFEGVALTDAKLIVVF
jgi:hypothetical protein